jgi:hypothetical protein
MHRVIIALLLAPSLAPSIVWADAPIEFNRDVRPILSDACFNCHGFDAKARKAKLRLDVPEGAFASRKGITAIKPGDLQASEVWNRITSSEPTEVMPPPHTNKTLTAAQKNTIRLWIEQGAKYQNHWSFEPIRRPAVPKVNHAGTPIDAFLTARQQKASLAVQPEADRETLVRRVSFALTGLPPTLKEVDAYLNDVRPGAYERMVDRYLALAHYGEEMARHWLDVARYADTHGLHLDNERQMWLYRDWVVQAFNENLPFDQFTVWQLAGDLLPKATPQQLAATGFNRCNVTSGEGGSIEAEWVYRNAVDRTNTMTQAWLGLTAGCANCHDHKFDPISMREYYSLYAFFVSAAGPALDGNVSTSGPFEKIATPAQKATLDAAIKAETDARKRLEQAALGLASAPESVAQGATAKRSSVEILLDDTTPFGATNRNTTRNAPDWLADPAFGAKSGRRVLRQVNSFFHEDTFAFQLRPVVVPSKATLEAWVRLDPGSPAAAVAMKAAEGGRVWWGKEPPAMGMYGGGQLGTHKGALPSLGVWTKLTVPVAELGLKEGERVASLTLQEHGGIVYWDRITLVGESTATDPEAAFQAWWKGLNGKAPPELPDELKNIVKSGPAGKHLPNMIAKLGAFFLAYVASAENDLLAKHQAAWEKARTDRAAAETAIPGTLIFRDLDTPRDAFMMSRGQYDQPGDKVSPGVPAALPPLKVKPGARPTRLDLANWLVAEENPLVARVAVNRLWQQFFGVGLVKTSADFGSQGEPPSHPELLDWLAAEYRNGWNTKKLVRQLVLSDAFRRHSKQTIEARAKDPENRLLARGPRFRLDAEQVRDNALFVSGLIDLKMGGRGVKPYQPANIWEPIGYGDSNTRYYLQDRGSAVHRRSLYVFIKRSAPHPFLSNFDGPNREQPCAARDRTNTPLQALQLMNDTQHFEAARALAERTLAEGGSTVEARIEHLYRLVLSRRPDAVTIRLIAKALQKQHELYQADPTAARRVITVGESQPRRIAPDDETAAWTMIANLILNLDETLNRN